MHLPKKMILLILEHKKGTKNRWCGHANKRHLATGIVAVSFKKTKKKKLQSKLPFIQNVFVIGQFPLPGLKC